MNSNARRRCCRADSRAVVFELRKVVEHRTVSLKIFRMAECMAEDVELAAVDRV